MPGSAIVTKPGISRHVIVKGSSYHSFLAAMIATTISALFQVLLFTLVPFLVYLLRHRSVAGFLHYIGMYGSPARALYLALAVSSLYALPTLGLALFDTGFRELLFDSHSVTGQLRQMDFGIETIYVWLVLALVKTALAEEIFFRGFVAKRLITLLGYQFGNWSQATIFGLVHVLLFVGITNNVYYLVVIFLLPAIGAFASVYLNEKAGQGSIMPGWLAHGLANLLAYGLVGFVLW